MAESTEQEQSNQTHQRLQDVTQLLEQGMFVRVRRMLEEMEPEDTAHLLEASPPKGRLVLWQLTDPEDQGEILDELSEDVKDGIIVRMAPDQLAAATEGMETDDVAYLLRSLPQDVSQDVLAQMDAQDRTRVQQALSYPEESAGGIMNTDVVTIRDDVTVDVVLRYLRMRGQIPDTTDTLYVIDPNGRLIGNLPISALLVNQPDVAITDIMEDSDEAISVTMDDGDVAHLFERRNWVSAPVVDAHNHLVGRITIDDVVDIIREDAEHSMMSMAGLDDEEDTFAPAFKKCASS